jgi:hypothetical protein
MHRGTWSRRLARCAVGLGATILMVSGCTSVVQGHGDAVRASAGAGPTQFPSASASSSAPPATSRFARTPVSTIIGDPVTAHMCYFFDAALMDTQQISAETSFRSYQPGCDIHVYGDDDDRSMYVQLRGLSRAPSLAGAAKVTASGLAVYRHAYAKASRDCERDVRADAHLWVTIDAYPDGDHPFSAKTTCTETDAAATSLSAGIAGHPNETFLLPDNSLSALDFCKVLRAADLGAAPMLAHGRFSSPSFGSECVLRTSSAELTVQYVIGPELTGSSWTPLLLAGHHAYVYAAGSGDGVSYLSVQQPTQDGGWYEQIEADGYALSGSVSGAALATQAGDALAAFLDAAGLH